MPETLPYRDGHPIPPGYHVDTRIRRGLVIAGSITFGVMYLAAIGLGSDLNEETLYIPLVGPFIGAASVGDRPTYSDGLGIQRTATEATVVLLIIDGIAQIGGAAMLIAGFAAPQEVLVRDSAAERRVRVAPVMLGRGGWGLGVSGDL